jgi:hypothetical protein
MDHNRMKFNRDSHYWHIYDGRVSKRELVNGDELWIQVGETYYCTHIEWDEEWFVRLGKQKFWLHHKMQYRVI